MKCAFNRLLRQVHARLFIWLGDSRAGAAQVFAHLNREVARRDMVWPVVFFHHQLGVDLLAQILRLWAAGMEPATGRWIDGRWDVADQDDALALVRTIRVRNRDRRQKGVGVGMT